MLKQYGVVSDAAPWNRNMLNQYGIQKKGYEKEQGTRKKKRGVNANIQDDDDHHDDEADDNEDENFDEELLAYPTRRRPSAPKKKPAAKKKRMYRKKNPPPSNNESLSFQLCSSSGFRQKAMVFF